MLCKKRSLIFVSVLLLAACSDDPSTVEPLPTSGDITSEQLVASGQSSGGYYEMTITEDSDVTLVTDEFTLSSSDTGEPQKLIVSGKLTISN
jgi:hypothetical protein